MVNNIGILLKVTAYVIFGIAFIGGIALGNTYKMQNPAYKYVEDLIFNWPLMLGAWIGCSINGVLFLGIAEIIKLLQTFVNMPRPVDIDRFSMMR